VNALLQLALSRTREFNADIGAVHLTGDPEGLASALEKMEIYHTNPLMRIFLPGRGNPDPSLLRTHPATEERIKRLRSLIKRTHPVIPPELYELSREPRHISRITRRPRWHIGGLWH
ncbi:MAG: M48 family metalloprotease, partial [Pseudomonadota bacterium]